MPNTPPNGRLAITDSVTEDNDIKRITMVDFDTEIFLIKGVMLGAIIRI